FQAEDGIRDFHVTGVQTCALPISSAKSSPGTSGSQKPWSESPPSAAWPSRPIPTAFGRDSERRRWWEHLLPPTRPSMPAPSEGETPEPRLWPENAASAKQAEATATSSTRSPEP